MAGAVSDSATTPPHITRNPAAAAASTRQSALNTSLNNVAGADLTQTLTQLSQAQNAYQIALQSSSNIMQLRSTVLANLP